MVKAVVNKFTGLPKKSYTPYHIGNIEKSPFRHTSVTTICQLQKSGKLHHLHLTYSTLLFPGYIQYYQSIHFLLSETNKNTNSVYTILVYL